MAKYRIGKNNYEVNLTKKGVQLSAFCYDNCEVTFKKDVEFIFEDDDMLDAINAITHVKLYYKSCRNGLKFRHLEYNVDVCGPYNNANPLNINPHCVLRTYTRRVVCTDAEKAMFEKLLNAV